MVQTTSYILVVLFEGLSYSGTVKLKILSDSNCQSYKEKGEALLIYEGLYAHYIGVHEGPACFSCLSGILRGLCRNSIPMKS